MAETPRNNSVNPVDSSSQGNGTLKEVPTTPETPEMAAVRIAREAFFARARDDHAAPDAASMEAPYVAAEAAAAAPSRPAGPNRESAGGASSDISLAVTSPADRIASRHSGEGLLAVGVLSDLGGERAYRVWATADSEDLKAITDPQARDTAFETIVDNILMPEYREALSLVDYGLEREALRALNARGEARVDGPAPAINDAAESPLTDEPTSETPALDERIPPVTPAGRECDRSDTDTQARDAQRDSGLGCREAP